MEAFKATLGLVCCWNQFIDSFVAKCEGMFAVNINSERQK